MHLIVKLRLAAAVKDPFGALAPLWIAFAIYALIEGAALFLGNTMCFTGDVRAVHWRALGEGNAVASPATVRNASGGIRWALWRYRLTNDVCFADSRVGVWYTETVADCWYPTEFFGALVSLDATGRG